MYDLLIIGSGPAGMSAAIYAKRAGIKVAVIEKEFMGTGQIAESGRVDNYPGFFGISGYDLGEKLREHAESLDVEFIESKVEGIVKNINSENEAYFILNCEDAVNLETKTVILATGASPKRANIEGEEKYTGNGVSYCAICDGSFYKDKTVAVLGGGYTALDDALYLADISKTIYLIHRRNEFRGAQSTVAKLKSKENVVFLLNEEVAKICGNEEVESVLLKSGKGIPVDGVFVAFGSTPNSSILEHIVNTDEKGYIVALEDGKTSLDGLFVAGDVRTKRLRQVVSAVSDGANAVTSVIEYLRDEK